MTVQLSRPVIGADDVPMTTPRELLDVIADFVEARSDTSDGAADRLQQIAQRFDVILGEVIIERASVQNEG